MPARRDLQTGPPQLPAPELGPARAVRQLVPGAAAGRGHLHAPDHRPLSTTARTAARPTTPATTPTTSSAARSATPGRRWSSRRSSGCARSTTPSQYDAAASQLNRLQHMINREFMQEEKDFPLGRSASTPASSSSTATATPTTGCCMLETFDPHEPFHAPERLQGAVPDRLERRRSSTGRATSGSTSRRRRSTSCAPTTTRCVSLLRRPARPAARLFRRARPVEGHRAVLTTDHGFLLGEHDWWAKNRMPLYEEISHIPLFVHHPDFAGAGGRRGGRPDPDDRPHADLPRPVRRRRCRRRCRARSLLPLLAADAPQREAASSAMFGGADQRDRRRYTYYLLSRGPDAPGSTSTR